MNVKPNELDTSQRSDTLKEAKAERSTTAQVPEKPKFDVGGAALELGKLRAQIDASIASRIWGYGRDGKAARVGGASSEPMTADQSDQVSRYVRAIYQKAGIEYKEMTPEEAQSAISDDGYWGAPQTSKRILDFVSTLTAGNPELADKVREGVKRGFAQAKEMLGDWLPDVSNRTYDLVMKGLDDMFPPAKAAEQSDKNTEAA